MASAGNGSERAAKKGRRVEQMLADVQTNVNQRLERIAAAVTASLTSDGSASNGLGLKVRTVQNMLDDYAEGVAAWRLKATAAVKDIEGRQRTLRAMLAEEQAAAERRRETFVEGQRKRARDADTRCREIMSAPLQPL